MEKSNLIPIEKGRINATAITLLKIAKALGVEVKELF
jgi:transcriptional regulator with XRE-family HTH domain